jgi:hypothetical protein
MTATTTVPRPPPRPPLPTHATAATTQAPTAVDSTIDELKVLRTPSTMPLTTSTHHANTPHFVRHRRLSCYRRRFLGLIYCGH